MTPPSCWQSCLPQHQHLLSTTSLHCNLARWRACIRRASTKDVCLHTAPPSPSGAARHLSAHHKCCSTGAVSTSLPSNACPPAEYKASPMWQAMLVQLAAWRAEHGSCHVPRNAFDAQKLAEWVVSTRKAARKGQLSTEEREQLDQLDFVWRPDVVGACHGQHTCRCSCCVVAAPVLRGSVLRTMLGEQ